MYRILDIVNTSSVHLGVYDFSNIVFFFVIRVENKDYSYPITNFKLRFTTLLLFIGIQIFVDSCLIFLSFLQKASFLSTNAVFYYS